MKKSLLYLTLLLGIAACNSNQNAASTETETAAPDETALLVDSLLYYRHRAEKTDILARRLPNITREQAIELQLGMLEKELAAGKKLVGWKMGGTVTDDPDLYDPLFGYILDTYMVEEGSVVSAEDFPGGQTMVEGEVGFILNKDFENGADSMEALKEGVDQVISAVEFAQATAIPVPGDTVPLPINYVLATGMGQAGTLVGSGSVSLNDFDAETETVKCFIDDQLVAEGDASRIYQGPLSALYSLANLLPKYGYYLKQGDIVITGSLYDNPTIDRSCQVRLEYSNLGTINFSME